VPNFDIGAWLRDPVLIGIVSIGVALFLVSTVIWGIRAHRQQILAGREELIGKTAEVKTFLNPRGTVFVDGETWKAISDTDVKPGEEVTITKVQGLTLHVTKKA
jgi:membrane-bound serine protease (ClpP class)